MTKMNYAQLSLPPYEWIKKLPLKHKVARKNRLTGKVQYSTEHCEYSFKLFDTPTSVYGRFTYNEDDQRMIIFDVMEGGYCGENHHGLALKFNKVNYEKICKHAQEVYEQFQRELFKSQEWQWSKDPADYAEGHYDNIIF